MYLNEDQMEHLPSEYPGELLPSIRNEFVRSGKTIVVLDDDPTGTQTCYDVKVLMAWGVDLLAEELKKKPSILFILTNSRSMAEKAAVTLTLEICRNLKDAAAESGREIITISRSDSTLRGHFPAEVAAIVEALGLEDAIWIIVPAFIEGGRVTMQDVHYILEQKQWVPVGDTPFARDAVFGYQHSNLRDWVEEKTKGRTRAADVISISLEDLRIGGPQAVCEKLKRCIPGKICIVNAGSYKDLEVFVMGVIMAEKSGQTFLYRTSATFVPIRAGIVSGKIFQPERAVGGFLHGALLIVGSYVPKTTSQLSHLLEKGSHQPIEINVAELLHLEDTTASAESIVKQTDQWIASGKDVVIYTSRQLETGKDAEHSLRINSLVSSFLVRIVRGLTVRPSFMVSKGGITSSDIASKGLSAEKAMILGQIIPGVPVWQLDSKSKFPEMTYVVFPGNVGDQTALAEVCNRLNGGVGN